MSIRTFFRNGVINVHNRAADGELVTALERIAEALSNLPTAVTINNPVADPVKTVIDANQYVKAYVDLDAYQRDERDAARTALITYRVAFGRFDRATRELDLERDPAVRRLTALKVNLRRVALTDAWLRLSSYFDLTNREAAGDD